VGTLLKENGKRDSTEAMRNRDGKAEAAKKKERGGGGKSQWQRNFLSKKLNVQLDDEIEQAQGEEMPSPLAKEC